MAEGNASLVLAVTVEVWPGGDLRRRRVIGLLSLANISQLADVSDYTGYLDGEPVSVTGHVRSDGAWKLVHTVLTDILQTSR